MPLNTTDRLDIATSQVEADAQKLHAIVNGSETSADVLVEGGFVKPIAKIVREAQDLIDTVKTGMEEQTGVLSQAVQQAVGAAQTTTTKATEVADNAALVTQKTELAVNAAAQALAGTLGIIAFWPRADEANIPAGWLPCNGILTPDIPDLGILMFIMRSNEIPPTPTPSPTPTPTPTPTEIPPTPTPTPTEDLTPTPTPTPTEDLSPTPTPTEPEPTPTPTEDLSPTPTPTEPEPTPTPTPE
jgi:hypothetical protein